MKKLKHNLDTCTGNPCSCEIRKDLEKILTCHKKNCPEFGDDCFNHQLNEATEYIQELLNKRELPPAIGVSQWYNYGIKYNYTKFWFKQEIKNWRKNHKDLRFGQTIWNTMNEAGYWQAPNSNALFYIEDDELAELIKSI